MIATRRQAVDIIKRSMSTSIPLENEDFETVVFAVNADVQVRDWLLGMPIQYGVEDTLSWFKELVGRLTLEDSVPFLTIQAALHYEAEEQDRAKAILKYVKSIDPDYSLASLLDRVFKANWPISQFAEMRKELHPKVVEVCEGEEGDLPIEQG